jgi:tetratricopeptide (TPR) repeat protein
VNRLCLLVTAAMVWGGCSDDDRVARQNPARIRLQQELGQVRQDLQRQPDSHHLYFEMGQIYERYGQIDSALSAYEHCVTLLEAFPEAHSRLGDLHFQRQQLPLATAAYEQAARFAPGDAKIHNNLGFVYRRQGRIEAAIDAYERALEYDSMMVEAINNLGQVQRESGDTLAATENFRRAIRIDADFRPAYVNLAKMFAESGLTELEMTLLEQMVSRFGTSSKEGSYARARLLEIDA